MSIELEKPIIITFIILVIIIVFSTQLSSINSDTKTNIGSLDLKQDEYFCKLGSTIDIVSCETSSKTNLDSGCSEKQIKKWEAYKNYLNEKDCDKLASESKKGEDKKLACTCLQQKIYDLINKSKIDDNKNINPAKVLKTYKVSLKEVSEFKKTKFYSLIKPDFENFAKENNIDVNVLYSIVITEGAYKNSFEDNVRFECQIFNKYMKKNILSCDCYGNTGCTGEKNSNLKSFSTNPLQTNYQAYLKAKKINPEFAFKSSSFGFGQIMGFNLDYSLFGDLDKLKDVSIQTKQFFYYLKEKNLIKNLQGKNWDSIAKGYNGVAYAQNNYQNKLKNNYGILVSKKYIS